MNEHLLAAARSISQPPLVAAVHPPRHHAAPRARRLGSTGPDQNVNRLACRDYALDDQAGQVGEQDAENLKIARPA